MEPLFFSHIFPATNGLNASNTCGLPALKACRSLTSLAIPTIDFVTPPINAISPNPTIAFANSSNP